jgi:hypothetical protein
LELDAASVIGSTRGPRASGCNQRAFLQDYLRGVSVIFSCADHNAASTRTRGNVPARTDDDRDALTH